MLRRMNSSSYTLRWGEPFRKARGDPGGRAAAPCQGSFLHQAATTFPAELLSTPGIAHIVSRFVQTFLVAGGRARRGLTSAAVVYKLGCMLAKLLAAAGLAAAGTALADITVTVQEW